MISDHDRSYYIGASDTKFVMGNWNTQTFRNWWNIKMGFYSSEMDNIYLRTGSLYEPRILDYLEVEERDRQIILSRLRVNLDGERGDSVIEVKTYGWKPNWKPPKEYLNQVQVELFATNKQTGWIVAYGVTEEDYEAAELGFALPIEDDRISTFMVNRDDKWIEEEYLPRLWYLAECLEEEKLPCMEDFLEQKKN